MAGRFWREAATLVIVGRSSHATATKFIKNFNQNGSRTNYKILFQKRSAKSLFMPSTLVFPGGVLDQADLDPKWISIFKSHGFSEEELIELFRFQTNRVDIYTNKKEDDLLPEVAFRICALRETFEETGLLLASANRETRSFAPVFPLKSKELIRWRKLVHSDASQFMNLMKHLEAVPAVETLSEWSYWLTPTTFQGMKSRFDTVFYVAFVDSEIPLHPHDDHEAEELKVEEPYELLQAFDEDKVILTPPQIYELRRFLNFRHLEDLKQFAEDRNSLGVSRWMAVIAKGEEGIAVVFPGDDAYPESPDLFSSTELFVGSLKEARKNTQHLHRIECSSSRLDFVVKNITQEHGHVNPVCAPQVLS